MQDSLQITYRGMEPSAALDARIRERAARMQRFDDRITSCHVTVQAAHRHQHQGQRYEVRIQIRRPHGGELVISHGWQDPSHEDVYVAVRDAFEAAERRLEDQRDRRER
jgi:ribosomal subunit interface protein